MKEIKCIVENIKDAIHDADRYAKLALEYKDVDRALADSYWKIANNELDAINQMHSHAVRMINASQEKPPAMVAVWEYEHKNKIEWVTRIKAALDMYKS